MANKEGLQPGESRDASQFFRDMEDEDYLDSITPRRSNSEVFRTPGHRHSAQGGRIYTPGNLAAGPVGQVERTKRKTKKKNSEPPQPSVQ